MDAHHEPAQHTPRSLAATLQRLGAQIAAAWRRRQRRRAAWRVLAASQAYAGDQASFAQDLRAAGELALDESWSGVTTQPSRSAPGRAALTAARQAPVSPGVRRPAVRGSSC